MKQMRFIHSESFFIHSEYFCFVNIFTIIGLLVARLWIINKTFTFHKNKTAYYEKTTCVHQLQLSIIPSCIYII